jgi:ABC-type transport system involved in multi-copper enzyme maturation permease subunit
LFLSYAAWLLLQFLVLFGAFDPEPRRDPWTPYNRMSALEVQYRMLEARARFASRYVDVLLYQQMLAVLFLTPALTGGALASEKERGTLQLLFTTELSAWEIVIGKLLGRLGSLALIALLPVPLLILMAELGGFSLLRFLAAFTQAAVIAFTLASASILTAVATKHTREAILGSYALIFVAYLTSLAALADAPLPLCLNPFEVLQRLGPESPRELLPAEFAVHVAVWSGIGIACVAASVRLLRPLGLRQLEDRSRRAGWQLRPGVGENPVLWRERYIIGLAPLPWLRRVPTYLALLGAFAFSLTIALTAVPEVVGRGFYPALRGLDFNLAKQLIERMDPSRAYWEIAIMGVVLLILAALVVGVRATGCIAEEKRRKTWDDLCMTPMCLEEILQAKMWGIVGAALPYVGAYLVPMLAFSCIAGIGGVLMTLFFLGATLLTVAAAAHIGTNFSGAAETAHPRVKRWIT